MRNRLLLSILALMLMNSFMPMSFADDPKPAEAAVANAANDVKTAGAEVAAKVEEAVEAKAEEAKSEEAAEEPAIKSWVENTAWSLLPPIIAIALALITKEVYSSLFIGVLLGAMMHVNYAAIPTIDSLVKEGLVPAVSDTAGIFLFLCILGIMVALINKTGAASAFGSWAKKHIKSRAGAVIATFILGVLIFIDDYFNCLTVGSVMLPVTDSKKISRAKLAYIIDATAAPICMIAPISSWAAAVSEFAEGTGYDGLHLFIKAIPFNFYSLLTFIFIIGITLMKVDYGPMAKHEKNAMEKGDLFTFGEEVTDGVKPLPDAKGKIIDILVPIIILIIFSIIGLLFAGGWPSENFMTAFGDTDATIGLPWGGVVVLFITMIYLLLRRVISFKDAMKSVPEGVCAMVPAIIILTLAISLKNMTVLLGSKVFIKTFMESHAAGLNQFLPAVIFIVACVISFATGTSWGTFGILIPIVCNIFQPSDPLLYIGMSACLAGSVCGDHCSPISDTTIMSSAGARCQHINHVSTQLPYAITVALISFISFLLSGFIPNWFVVFPIAVIITLGFLFFMKTRMSKAA